jgi:hypothetical protein
LGRSGGRSAIGLMRVSWAAAQPIRSVSVTTQATQIKAPVNAAATMAQPMLPVSSPTATTTPLSKSTSADNTPATKSLRCLVKGRRTRTVLTSPAVAANASRYKPSALASPVPLSWTSTKCRQGRPRLPWVLAHKLPVKHEAPTRQGLRGHDPVATPCLPQCLLAAASRTVAPTGSAGGHGVVVRR